MDDDDMTEENTPLNSEEEREMVGFALEALRCQHSKDKERAEKRGEPSTSRGMGSGHGLLAAHMGDASESGPARSLKARIEGSSGFPAKGSCKARAEGSRQTKPHVAVLLRVPMPDQMPPGGNSKYVTDQTDFCLQHIMGTSRSEGGHTFVRRDTKWDTNAIKLWLNPLSTKGWYWNNGRQLQMARKAAEIPFDQRSLAQRWAIREATAAETLPEGLCYNTVRTPTLCKPDTSDRPLLFFFQPT
jgi:hypothetical protein